MSHNWRFLEPPFRKLIRPPWSLVTVADPMCQPNVALDVGTSLRQGYDVIPIKASTKRKAAEVAVLRFGSDSCQVYRPNLYAESLGPRQVMSLRHGDRVVQVALSMPLTSTILVFLMPTSIVGRYPGSILRIGGVALNFPRSSPIGDAGLAVLAVTVAVAPISIELAERLVLTALDAALTDRGILGHVDSNQSAGPGVLTHRRGIFR